MYTSETTSPVPRPWPNLANTRNEFFYFLLNMYTWRPLALFPGHGLTCGMKMWGVSCPITDTLHECKIICVPHKLFHYLSCVGGTNRWWKFIV